MNAAEKRLVDFAQRSTLAGNSISAPLVAAAGAVTALGAAMASAAVGGIELAISYERQAIALEVMTGSAAKGKKLLEEIIQLAIETPFKTPELLTNAGQLKAFGVETEHIIPTLRALGDVSSATHTPINRIALAFGQVKVAGRLMGPELRQFVDAGVPLIENLAKVMGKPQAAIKVMVEEGKVSFGTVVEAFNRMTGAGGIFENMNDRVSRTVSGRWSAFVETLQLVQRKLGDSFLNGMGINQFLKDAQEGLRGTDDFAAGLENFFKKVREGAEAVWGIAKAVGKWMEENQQVLMTILKVTGALIAFNAALAVIRMTLGAILFMTGILTLGWAALVVAAGVLIAAVLKVSGVMDLARKIIEGWAYGIKKAAEEINLSFGAGTFTALSDYFSQLTNSIGAMFAEMGSTISATWSVVVDAFKTGDLKTAFEAAFKGIELLWNVLVKNMTEQWIRFQYMIGDLIGGPGGRGAIAAGLEWYFSQGLAQTKRTLGVTSADEYRRESSLAGRRAGRDAAEAIDTRATKMQEEIKKATLEQTQAIMKGNEYLKLMATKTASEAETKKALAENRYWDLPAKDLADKFPGLAKLAEMTPQEFMPHAAVVGPAMFMRTLYPKEGVNAPPLAAAEVSAFKPIVDSNDPRDPRSKSYMPPPPEVSSEARTLATRLTREMERGIWATKDIDKFALFSRNMGLLQEAYKGPKNVQGMGGLVGGLGLPMMNKFPGVLEKQVYEFGIFEEYQNLRRSLNVHEQKLPPVALKGSAEAQDAINRGQNQVVNAQEEIKKTLIEAREIQKQMRDYQKKTVDTLIEMNEHGAFLKVIDENR